jgi:predicted dehydrogenase
MMTAFKHVQLSPSRAMEPRATSVDRRDFLKTASAVGAGLWLSGNVAPALAQRRSASDQFRVVVMGVEGRGGALARTFAAMPGAEVAYVAEVDERALAKCVGEVESLQNTRAIGIVDFRTALDDPEVDALVIAAPDHWHTPATILALKAGKHVYVEKPASHNPREAELIVAAQRKYDRLVQMGNQQRSDPNTIEAVREIHGGLIGRPYYGRAWYANTRGPISRGQVTSPPSWLDFELWQGPAPRRPYQDNLVHYNWHWFWNWGTGEIANNGTHELDLCRWAMQVDHPVRVTSAGGRYHFDDDWEFYDTQDAAFDFAAGKTIVWQGRSCNGFPIDGRSRGVSIHGTEGTVVMDRSGYSVYDLRNNLVREAQRERVEALAPGGDRMTDLHIGNFIESARTDAPLNSPIDEGQKSVLLCHLGNIAQKTERSLRIDPQTGRVRGDRQAARMWSRQYARGWQPTV